MKILHLTLTAKWFAMIAQGIKKEEYRELTDYWKARLHDKDEGEYLFFTDFDIIRFKNGYAKDAPTMDVEWKNTQVRSGNPLLGAIEHKPYYVIQMGELLSIENYKMNEPLTGKAGKAFFDRMMENERNHHYGSEKDRYGAYFKEDDTWIGIDNNSGDCWTEEFDSEEEAKTFAEGGAAVTKDGGII